MAIPLARPARPVHPHSRGNIRVELSAHPRGPVYGSRAPVHPHSRGETCYRQRVAERGFTVHPHSRGEQLRGARRAEDAEQMAEFHPTRVGTCRTQREEWVRCPSPLAWGTRLLHARRRPRRFTPTRVGNMQPRVDERQVRLSIGSSPLAWGNMRDAFPCWYSRIRAVHPHSRGGNMPPIAPRPETVHPHSRGEHQMSAIDSELRDRRFIPTRVGNNTATVCSGERGSSPLAWGTLTAGSSRGSDVGDGSSPLAWGIWQICCTLDVPSAVHPPLAWGNIQCDGLVASFHRFIPTRVGNIHTAL